MMNLILRVAAAAVVFAFSLWAQQAGDTLWAPKATKAGKYTPPHKPHTKIADLKAKHAGEPNWRELVVDDDHLRAEYISSAPGTKVPKQLHPDTRAWWVVMEGQIRFEIEGEKPFVATERSMVQVPMQTIFSMETVGDRPAMRFEVNIAKAKTLYVQQSDAPKLPGFDWISVNFKRIPGVYGKNNKAHATYAEMAAKGEQKNATYRVVEDDRGAANFIYGYEKNLPPLDSKFKGHYHPEGSEFWLIMTGQIRYPIENHGVVIASQGDVVYVPPFTYHAPRFHGLEAACRLAMNGYPNIAHLF